MEDGAESLSNCLWKTGSLQAPREPMSTLGQAATAHCPHLGFRRLALLRYPGVCLSDTCPVGESSCPQPSHELRDKSITPSLWGKCGPVSQGPPQLHSRAGTEPGLLSAVPVPTLLPCPSVCPWTLMTSARAPESCTRTKVTAPGEQGEPREVVQTCPGLHSLEHISSGLGVEVLGQCPTPSPSHPT